jgi:hypothetical protein
MTILVLWMKFYNEFKWFTPKRKIKLRNETIDKNQIHTLLSKSNLEKKKSIKKKRIVCDVWIRTYDFLNFSLFFSLFSPFFPFLYRLLFPSFSSAGRAEDCRRQAAILRSLVRLRLEGVLFHTQTFLWQCFSTRPSALDFVVRHFSITTAAGGQKLVP